MRCKNCNVIISSNTLTCPCCGYEKGSELFSNNYNKSYGKFIEIDKDDNQDNVLDILRENYTAEKNTINEQSPKKRKKYFIIAIIVIILLIIGLNVPIIDIIPENATFVPVEETLTLQTILNNIKN